MIITFTILYFLGVPQGISFGPLLIYTYISDEFKEDYKKNIYFLSELELIIRFGIMEFKYGEEDQGAAIFETVLSNDPKKVTAWTIYVDQLVKKDRIDQAR